MARKRSRNVEVRDAVVRFCKRHLGRGPRETRVFIMEDRVLISLRGLLGAGECDLAVADESGTVAGLLAELFRRLIEHHRLKLEVMLAEGLGTTVRSVQACLCARTDEANLVVALDNALGPVAEQANG